MLLFVVVCRTIFVRVWPDDVIVFEPTTYADDPEGGGGDQHHPTFFARVRASLEESSSLFAWADRGQWMTTETGDRAARREGDWFRIGFAPIFVDYTQNGSWYMVYSLLQV